MNKEDEYWLNEGSQGGKVSPCVGHDKQQLIDEQNKKLQEINNNIFQKELEKRIFDTGAKRDTNTGKIRPDLISPIMLKSLGKVMAEGANHYGERNWEKGMPLEVFKESAARHYVSWMNNENDEDHASKLIFNIMAWIHFKHNEQKLQEKTNNQG